jgi:hypothetical protein
MASPGEVVRLRAGVVATRADKHGRLEDLGVEASDRPIPLMQIVIVEGLLLRRLPKDRERIAALRLVLAGVRSVLAADPAQRLGHRIVLDVRREHFHRRPLA